MRQGLGLVLLCLFSLLCHAADEAVDNGKNWLISQARDDGAFHNTSTMATAFQATAEVLRIDGLSSGIARDFLQQSAFQGSEYLARRLRLGAGDSTALHAALEQRQNPDGGFGDLPGYQSSVLDSAHALAVLDPATPGVSAGVDFLLASQYPDGGWADGPNESGIFSTALALEGLQRSRLRGDVAAAREAGRDFLLAQLGASPPIHLQALALRALLPMENADTLVNPLAALRAAQSVDGSWEGDVYTTALAVQVLGLAGQVPFNPDQAVVRGVVLSATTGWPLAGATVNLDGTQSFFASSDAAGAFRFSGVTPGEYQLSVSEPNHETLQTVFQVAGGEDRDLGSLFLARPLDSESIAVFGTVSDSNRVPLAGVRVSIPDHEVFTDAEGRYWLMGLSAGTVEIQASLAGYQTVSSNLVLSPGSYMAFSAVLYQDEGQPPDSLTELRGIVVDALTGERVVAATVLLDGRELTRTSSYGSFLILMSASLGGEVSVGIRMPGYRPWDMSVRLNVGQRNDLGFIRLAPEDPLLADLVVMSVDGQGVVSDPVDFSLRGEVQTRVGNFGSLDSGAVRLTVFADSNADGARSPGEPLLGEVSVPPLATGMSTDLSVVLEGYGDYRDPPLLVLADSGGEILEIREDNNTASSLNICRGASVAVSDLEPVEKWRWANNAATTTPIVAPIQDSNGDGRVSAADDPAVLLITHGGWPDGSAGVLNAVDGITGITRWSVSSPGVHAASQLAVGDLDADGFPEIIALRYPTGTVAFDGDGQILWESPYPDYQVAGNYGGVSLADLDGDGLSEILYTRLVLNADGSVRWLGAGSGHGGGLNVVADLHNDGSPEVVVGNTLYAADGQLLWEQALPDGRVAVANLDADPDLEIVLSGRAKNGLGALYALDPDGTVIWGPVQFASNQLGAATIGDVNGDGRVEIGVASTNSYTLLDADGSPLWQQVIRDFSGVTAASFFDLDNDGIQEVIYADSETLWILDGQSGLPRYQLANPSYTGLESTTVVDVDNDGHAEVLLVSSEQSHTLRVLENFLDDWPRTRAIRNQYAYHPGAVGSGGEIPLLAGQGWGSFNAFRNNPPTGGPALADWTLGGLQVVQQPSGLNALSARVANAGAADGSATVRFFQAEVDGERLLGERNLTLQAGQFADLLLDGVSLRGEGLLSAEVLGISADAECGGDNNHVSASVSGPGLGELSLTASDQTTAGEPFTLSATAYNPGSLVQGYELNWQVEDLAGVRVRQLPGQSFGVLQGGAYRSVVYLWEVDTLLAGEYRLVARLEDALGNQLDQQSLTLVLLGDEVPATATLVLRREEYQPADAVSMELMLHNPSSNQWQASGELILTAVDSMGQIVATRTLSAPALAPGQYQMLASEIRADTPWPTGDYVLQVEWISSAPTVHLSADFRISESLLAGLLASVVVDTPLLADGDGQQCEYTVENPAPGGQFRVAVHPLDAAVAVDWLSLEAPTDGGVLSYQQLIDAGQLAAGDWICEIQVNLAGSWQGLAYGGFTLSSGDDGGSGPPVGDPLPLFPDHNDPPNNPDPDLDPDLDPDPQVDEVDDLDADSPDGDLASELGPVAIPLLALPGLLMVISVLLLIATRALCRDRLSQQR